MGRFDKVVSFRISDDAHAALQEIINVTGESASEVLRSVTEEGLSGKIGTLGGATPLSLRIYKIKSKQDKYRRDVINVRNMHEHVLEIEDPVIKASMMKEVKVFADELGIELK